jgi:hypothetical protein
MIIIFDRSPKEEIRDFSSPLLPLLLAGLGKTNQLTGGFICLDALLFGGLGQAAGRA